MVTKAKSLFVNGIRVKAWQVCTMFLYVFCNMAGSVKKKSIQLKDFIRLKPVEVHPKKTIKTESDRS